MVTITKEYDKDSVADGTVEGEEESFSPDAGLTWSLKYVKWNGTTADEDLYMELTVSGRVLLTMNTGHIPSNPDLVPVDLEITPEDEIKVRTTNQSGAGADVWCQLFIDES